MKNRKSISYTKRQIIFARDRWECVYCYKKASTFVVKEFKHKLFVTPVDDTGKEFEIDHVIPYCETQDNTINNLCTACWKCNNRKSNHKLPKNFPYFKSTVDLEGSS